MDSNVQKIREALGNTNKWISRLLETGNDDSDYRMIIGELLKCKEINKAALSLPIRNCDRFWDGADAENAFEEEALNHKSKTANQRDELMRENWFLFRLWLFQQKEEEKNDPKTVTTKQDELF